MNEPNDPVRDELRDRLLDQALRETLGAESPPDLSERILAAADEAHLELPEGKGEKVMDRPKRWRWVWAAVASAACLLIGTAAILLPAIQNARETARRSTCSNSLRSYGGAMHNYHDAYQRYGQGDSQGEALHFEGSTSEVAEPPVAFGQVIEDDEAPVRRPLMQGGGVQFTRIAGPGTIPSRPVHGSQQSQSRKSVQPGDTGRYKFSAGVNSDSGLIGSIEVPGEQTLPSPYYTQDDVQYFPPGEDFRLAREVAKLREAVRQKELNNDVIVSYSTVQHAGNAQKVGEVGSSRNEALARLSLQQLHAEIAKLNQQLSANGGQRDSALLGTISKTDAANTLAVEKQDLERQAALASEQLANALEVLRKFSLTSGQGPGRGGDQYVRLVENPFLATKLHRWSTFSIDVDTASYANVRRFLLKEGQLPPPDAVRIEELVNYFDYNYSPPEGDVPFASHIEVAGCPWAPERRLVRIALKGREVETNQRPASNLVFLLDVSGSMNEPDKLPLLQAGMKLLAGQLRENDHVAIVVYAGSEGLVLPSTPGDQRAKILDAIDRLSAGGSTNGGAGIELAYKIAREQFLEGGVNRVILCTDGDFNVGTTSTGDLERMVEEKAKSGVFLSVLGFGRGNLNDAMMETISNKGNGNYAYIDGLTEAQKVLVQQMGGTLVTIAKDVKIQLEFNPNRVEAYRLIGYENRMLATEDFNDDKKDAGEIGAGHTVTALYEVVPAGGKVDLPKVDPSRYQPQADPEEEEKSQFDDELLVVKVRYKEPEGEKSKLLEFPVTDQGDSFAKTDDDFQFAAAVASFGMLLRGSAYLGQSSYDGVLEIAESAKGADRHGYRAELVEMVKRAKPLAEARAALQKEIREAIKAAEAELAKNRPPVGGVQGVVLNVAEDGTVEISLGSDDGLAAGKQLNVYRTEGGSSTRLGTIEVVKAEADKATCEVLQKSSTGEIKASDRVSTRLTQEQKD